MEYVDAREMFDIIHDIEHYSEDIARKIFK